MRKKLPFAVVAIVLVVSLSAASFSHSRGGLSIWFPDNWRVGNEEDELEATSPDGEAYAQLFVLDDVATLEEAVEIYSEELDQVVDNFRTDSPQGEEIVHNGLTIFLLDGEGEVDGVTLEIGMALIVSAKAVTMMITFNSREAAEKYAGDFRKIVSSLKAI